MKPFLKCLGGKRKYTKIFLRHAPQNYKRYIEPFFGAGALFFSLNPEKATIADINSELITVYQQILSDPSLVYKAFQSYKSKNSLNFFYETRSQNPDELHPVEVAARYIYLNKTCYSGNMRYNKQGELNVPYANYKNPAFPSEGDFFKLQDFLKSRDLVIKTGNFTETIGACRKGNFYYFDPPYYSPNNGFTMYSKNTFGAAEQIKLKEVCDHLSGKGCFVMTTNSDHQWIKDLYEGYKITSYKASRACNSNTKDRSSHGELLITNHYKSNHEI